MAWAEMYFEMVQKGKTMGKTFLGQKSMLFFKVIISLSTWLYINVFGTALLSGEHEQNFVVILTHYCDGLI